MPTHTKRRTRLVLKKKQSKSRKAHTKRKTHKTHKTHRRLRGGNYAKDVTVKEIEGVPVTKNAVVTVPGYGTMGGDAYKQLQADIDRNGKQLYD